MKELIDQIAQTTGISQQHAQQAAQTAIAFVKSKLPPSIAGQLDGLIGGGVSGEAGGGMAQKLSGALSGKS